MDFYKRIAASIVIVWNDDTLPENVKYMDASTFVDLCIVNLPELKLTEEEIKGIKEGIKFIPDVDSHGRQYSRMETWTPRDDVFGKVEIEHTLRKRLVKSAA